MHDKFIGMEGLNSMRAERLWWKVFQIEGDDDVGPGVDGGGQDVPVILVGQLDGFDQGLITHHQRVSRGFVH